MDAHPVGREMVDVCAQCGGVWVDWFDGELFALCKKLASTVAWRAEVEGGAARQMCPRCLVELKSELWNGHAVMRCVECSGAWLAREVAYAIAEGLRQEPVQHASAAENVDEYETRLRKMGGAAPRFDDPIDAYEHELRQMGDLLGRRGE